MYVLYDEDGGIIRTSKTFISDSVLVEDHGTLFEDTDNDVLNNGQFANEHWQGMPEFNFANKEPILSILVHFESKEDIVNFSKLINKKITLSTKSLFWPIRKTEKMVYADENK